MKVCACHGEPMEANPGSRSGWRCVIRRRANQRPKSKEKNGRRVWAGRTYLALASTTEEAQRVNQHVNDRLAEFKARQSSERKETRWQAER